MGIKNNRHSEVKEDKISHIVKFAGAIISILLKLINYYSTFYVVEHILSLKFEVVKVSDTIGPMESVAIERIKLWQQEFKEEIAEIINLFGMK